MDSRKAKRNSAAKRARGRLFRERIEAERRRIFSAMSIIDCCRYVHEYLPTRDDESPDITGALVVAHELLDQVAGELGCLADDERRR
jgi:hypothetical protein